MKAYLRKPEKLDKTKAGKLDQGKETWNREQSGLLRVILGLFSELAEDKL